MLPELSRLPRSTTVTFSLPGFTSMDRRVAPPGVSPPGWAWAPESPSGRASRPRRPSRRQREAPKRLSTIASLSWIGELPGLRGGGPSDERTGPSRIEPRRRPWNPPGRGRSTPSRLSRLQGGGDQPGVRGEAAAEQPVAESFPAPRQPALDRPDRPAQMPRRLLVGAALQVAEHHRRPVAFGQPVDLLVEQPAPARRRAPTRASLHRARRMPFVPCAAGRRPTGHTTRSDRPPDAARGPANPAPRARGPSRTRTRNVAWKASWVSCGSASTPRQTRSTIGPCRSTRTAKASSAASPRSVANRSRS